MLNLFLSMVWNFQAAGNLIFVAASIDGQFRAFDTKTGGTMGIPAVSRGPGYSYEVAFGLE